MVKGVKTRLTELLGITYPIIQGGMAWVSFAPLVAAVSNAGGFGIICGTILSGDSLREEIRKTKDLTDRPFGVNILAKSPILEDLLGVISDEKIPAVTYGLGNPKKIMDVLKPRGILCMPVVPSVSTAVRAENDGADVLIVEGLEAGGHVGKLSTFPLVPQVRDKVKVPVVAAGGIGDGRGLAAALMLGADGIMMGTRFICTQECPAHINAKTAVLKAQAEDTLVTGNITGLPVRALKNRFTETFAAMEVEKKSALEMALFGSGKMYKAFIEGDAEDGSVMAGQICGMITDIPTVRELVERTVKEAETALSDVARDIFSIALIPA